MARGIVRYFNSAKGYGYITPDGEAKDIFVHESAIQGDGFRTLFEEEPVEFDVAQTSRGPRAEKVVPLED